MLKKLFLVNARRWIKQNKIIDIVLFGSSARGKTQPQDIDFCIIIKDDDEKKSMDLTAPLNQLSKGLGLKIHTTILTAGAFISGNTLAKTLLNEGFSIKHGKGLAEVLGFFNKSLFVYSLKEFSSSQRVRFHYMLKGRYGLKGVLREANGQFLGTGTIIVPTKKEDILKEIFDQWKVEYTLQRILLN